MDPAFLILRPRFALKVLAAEPPTETLAVS
jgi:hypothetical protein